MREKFIVQYIRTIDELLNFISYLDLTHNQPLWFRGVANKDWELVPSVQRTQERTDAERYITNDFYIKARQVIEHPPEKHNYAAWMSIMQHYGLPTRLLDWSCSPLIASFFAVEQYAIFPKTDACIWILVPRELNEAEGFGKCIYPVDADTAQDMLIPAFKERGHVCELENKILACHSTENNLRMYSQQAAFTIHNSQRKLTDICRPDMLYKIIIPAEVRESMLNNLRIFGITESYIYPDLDHISKDTKRIFQL